MTRIALFTVFVLVAAMAVTAPLAAANAGGSSCTASGIFSSCRADCQPGERAVCSSGFLGTSVSCECLPAGGGVASILGSALWIENPQVISYRGYADLLAGFGTPEGDNALATAEAMQDAANRNDYADYEVQAMAHENALNQLSPAEMTAVEEYIYGPDVILP